MRIRTKLRRLEPEAAVNYLWTEIDPETIPLEDVKSLALIVRNRRRDPLGFLGLEIAWWLRANQSLIRKRIKKEL